MHLRAGDEQLTKVYSVCQLLDDIKEIAEMYTISTVRNSSQELPAIHAVAETVKTAMCNLVSCIALLMIVSNFIHAHNACTYHSDCKCTSLSPYFSHFQFNEETEQTFGACSDIALDYFCLRVKTVEIASSVEQHLTSPSGDFRCSWINDNLGTYSEDIQNFLRNNFFC